jgi:hypothetical protein
LNVGGRPLTNSLAADFAAWMRLGATSVASIDSDTSMASMMVARSRGSLVSTDGRARPATRTSSASRKALAAKWRRGPMPRGASTRSMSTLVKRIAKCLRRSWRHT